MNVPILRLPVELFADICGYLPNSSIKALRLSCKQASKTAPLRLDRVFLSVNPLNVVCSWTARKGARPGLRENAERISSAPAAHGWLPEARPWEDKAVKKSFRGFGIVTRAQAQHPDSHHVSEFTIDVNQLLTGLNCRLFENQNEPEPEYIDFKTLLRRPNFTRLDLALVRGHKFTGWPCYRNGLLAKPAARLFMFLTRSLSAAGTSSSALFTTQDMFICTRYIPAGCVSGVSSIENQKKTPVSGWHPWKSKGSISRSGCASSGARSSATPVNRTGSCSLRYASGRRNRRTVDLLPSIPTTNLPETGSDVASTHVS
ncbi:hypothetical protein BJY01DRAFT_245461 [Aspergillus pseudoustus]|uniref:F-box domain-containing protein n=1 Tax=Aspergillus pseudoustus TaxID=1810923 RepID=A0ABR4KGE9_9EURO